MENIRYSITCRDSNIHFSSCRTSTWSRILVSATHLALLRRTNISRFYGWRIIRAMGSHITQLSPVRGFSVELGTAITVLMASQLGIPVSTTQCLTGALIGVGLMNGDAG